MRVRVRGRVRGRGRGRHLEQLVQTGEAKGLEVEPRAIGSLVALR